MPFVQGQLRNEPVRIHIDSQCAHCERAIRLELDSELNHRLVEGGAPLVFVPLVDFERIKAAHIIDDF